MTEENTTSALVEVTGGLWRVRTWVRVVAGFHMPVSMTVLALPDGGLVLYSPVPIDEAVGASLDALGPVRAVMAPNLLHHLWLPAAVARYPQARVIVPRGLEAKHPELTAPEYAEELAEDAIEGLRLHAVAGLPKLAEVVVLHEASETLVVGDLVFNVDARRGLLSGLILRLAGTAKGPAGSRLVKSLVKDRAATRASLDHLLTWPITRIAPGHGSVITADALEVLRAAGHRLAGAR